MVQLYATRCSYIAILWVSLAIFAAITLCVASQRAFILVSVYFVMTQSGNFRIHPRIMKCFKLLASWTFGRNFLSFLSVSVEISGDLESVISVGIANRLGWTVGVWFPLRTGNFPLLYRVWIGSGAHPAFTKWATDAPSLVVNGPGREADHSHRPGAEVKNAWSYTSFSPIHLHGVLLN
jgi:hypothetical protein